MKVIVWVVLLVAVTVISVAAKEFKPKNGTRIRKVVRKVKKKATKFKKSEKLSGERKSESIHFPIHVNPSEIQHELVPIQLEISNDHHSAEEPYYRDFIPKDYYQGPKFESQPDTNDYYYQNPKYEYQQTHSNDYYHSPKHESQQPDTNDYFNSNQQYFEESDYGALDNAYVKGSDVDSNYQQAVVGYSSPEYHVEEENHHATDLSSIPGVPGVDYPIYASLPETHFKCLDHTETPGFYADVDTKCQVWHYCQPDGRHDRFLCPNGTVFDQLSRVCNWWYNVHCEASLSMYDINFDLYRDPHQASSQHIDIQRKKGMVLQPTPTSVEKTKQDYEIPREAIKPNSFQSHVREFSANLAHQRLHAEEPTYRESIDNQPSYFAKPSDTDHRDYHQSVKDDPVVVFVENKEEDHHHHHHSQFPENLVHQQAHEDSLLQQQQVHDYIPALQPYDEKPKRTKKVPKRRRYKVYLHELSDGVPVYRERKASPPPGRKRRVAKRRKISKG